MSDAEEHDGCPCGTYGPCCTDPAPRPVTFTCRCEPGDCYCDENWMLECDNCGAVCGCEV